MKDETENRKKTKTHLSVKKKAIRFLLFGVASIALIGYFFTIVINMSLEIFNKYEEKEVLNTELDDLKEKEQELSTDVLKLQDPEYVGRYLREKYYYSKTGEYIIKLPNEK